ncbi:nuclease [Halorubrum distributum JCM 13916]|uniref:Nuclease n=2 Tax=Halorubrum distributum TaxID=29283 RepID=M0PP36_9EURY|nr:nuclease [Halorubrum arcis JCM 13916]
MPDGSTDTIRLLGVDTPETSAGATDPAEWPGISENVHGREHLANWAGQATSYAKERLAGQEIHIEVDEESDRRGSFDRLLVYASQSESSSKSFNMRLLENGYARMYDSQFTQRAEYGAAEMEARSNDVGVWDYTDTSESDSGSSSDSDSGSGSVSIEIAEIHEDAAGDEFDNLDDEYIVLENTGSNSVNMDGYTLEDDANHAYTFDSFTLGAGDSVTIYTGDGSDSDTELYWGQDAPVWNNGGDIVTVRDDNGNVIVQRSYD